MITCEASRVNLTKVHCGIMWEVREGMHPSLCRNVDVCNLVTAHIGGEVSASYLFGAAMTRLESGAALVGSHVQSQWAGGIGISTVEESASCLGATQDPKGEKYWLVGRGKALTTQCFARIVCGGTEVPKQLFP